MTDEQRLLAAILHNYDSNTRPVMNASTPVSVKLGITLNQIFDVVSISFNSTVLSCFLAHASICECVPLLEYLGHGS